MASAAELNAHDTGPDGKYMGIFLHYTITFIVVIAPVLVEKYVFQSTSWARWRSMWRELVNCEELQEMIRVLTEERDKALQYRWSWSRIATCTGAKQRR